MKMENSGRLENGRDNGLVEKVAAIAIFAAAAAFGFYRLRYGLSFKEEGLCLSTPFRFSIGEVPFRDEALVSLRWFEILMTPVMRLLPEKGSVLALRQLNLAFHFICLGALFYSLRKYFRPLLGAILFSASAYANIFNYWSPTYHSAAFDFICAALAFMIAGSGAASKRSAALRGLLSGVAFSFAWACELPAVAMLAVPGLVCVIELSRGCAPGRRGGEGNAPADNKRNGRQRLSVPFVCCAAAIAVSVALLAGSFAAIRSAGLSPDLLDAVKILVTIDVYGYGMGHKVALIARDMARALPWFAFHAACWGMFISFANLTRRGRRGIPALFAFLCAAVIYIGVPLRILAAGNILIMFYMTDYYEGLCILSFLAVPLALFSGRARWGSGERRICATLFAAGVVFHFALAVSAGSGALVGVALSLPFLFISLAMGAGRLLPEGGASRVSLAALCGCLAISLLASNMRASSDHAWTWQFSKHYENDRLRGVYHFSDSVESTDALVEYLKPRLREGDYLLSFYDNAMLYYLTGTRSAIDTGLPNHLWPPSTRARFVDRMVKRGKIPCYAVHLGSVDREPVYDFVRRNYVPVVRFGDYYVWKLRNGAGVCR